jgi:hypothetical protein
VNPAIGMKTHTCLHVWGTHGLGRVARDYFRTFWQSRFYDFNVYSEKKRIEKLRYIHRGKTKTN